MTLHQLGKKTSTSQAEVSFFFPETDLAIRPHAEWGYLLKAQKSDIGSSLQ
jgi:hypothetical protein